MRRYILLLLDIGLIFISTIMAFALRENFEIAEDRLAAALPYFAATAFFSLILVPGAGLNVSIWRYSSVNDYLRVTGVVTAISVGAVTLSFAYDRLEGIARSLPFLQVLVGTAVLVGARVLHRASHARRQARKESGARLQVRAKAGEMTVLVLGVNRLTNAYLLALSEFALGRVCVAGLISLAERHVGRVVARYPVLGVADDIESIISKLEIHGVNIDRIVLACPFGSLSRETKEALVRIERSGSIALQFLSEILGSEEETDSVHEPLACQSPASVGLHFELTPKEVEFLSTRTFWKLKRGLDIVAALSALIALSPAFVLVGLSVGFSVGFPVVFWQRRPGLNGKAFHLYKFRTMRAAHAPDGHLLSDSERVSRIGNFLRRTRLDELPQLFNILRGDMSFVGPRPLLPRDQPRGCSARLLVRPGLTGWAQVIGGRDIAPEDKAVLDIWYVRNASLVLDLKVAVRTIPIVLFGERISRSIIDLAWKDLTELGIAKGDFAPDIRNSLHLAKSNL